jgi:H+-translocating NAD(P) transhydrogenase subunit alpha
MIIGVLHTWPQQDQRVAAVPSSVLKWIQKGVQVVVQKGLGSYAGFSDEDYAKAGAEVEASADIVIQKSHFLFCLSGISPDLLSKLRPKTVIVGMLGGMRAQKMLSTYEKRGVSAFSLELLPRISRAQTMDVLSSQNNLYGYVSVLKALQYFKRIFPMMTTAAGSLPPARVLVLGAGVAGLQAIATAKRLGAVVQAMDIRAATKEQVESLGASFLYVEPDKKAESTAGYALEMNPEYLQKQRDLLSDTLKKTDIVLCTALVPGKSPPVLLQSEMISHMKPGSVILDLAADQACVGAEDIAESPSGNCALSARGKVISEKDITIVGPFYGLNQVCQHASLLYSQNLTHFLDLLLTLKTWESIEDDPLLKATCLTYQGKKAQDDSYSAPVGSLDQPSGEERKIEENRE